MNQPTKTVVFYSLRQIVMFAFMLVLLPLLWLSYQAYDGFNELSQKSAEINRNTAIYARRSEVMANVALELERSARQYCILNDSTFANLHLEQKKQFSQMLEAHKPVVNDLRFYTILSQILKRLNNLTCANGLPTEDYRHLLEDLSNTNIELSQATREAIFARGQDLQIAIAQRGSSVGRQALILCFVSFILVLLFTQMIIRPVAKIRMMINVIAEGRKLPAKQFNGPKEMQVLAHRIVWLSERLNWLESQRHEFLRHVSHELKTPLASIREGTELLADQVAGNLTTEQKEVVAILDESGRELQLLIEQLLEYNRQALIDEINLQEVAFAPLIDKAVSSHGLLLNQKNVTISTSLEISNCHADPILLGRVLDNLFSNAVHYGRDNGVIYFKSYLKEQNVILEVANLGTPIPEREREMIFEPFYQGTKQRSGPIKGSGLGLSIAQNALRRMQGELSLVDVEYADVCFVISLPSHA
ncbi:sensor histidine kinase [Thorsellia anophelis]|uniref:histidine kinase n=1 Tax=Thorsellia anophelis DSM 18579 TaxID=1123402 RepID=A0A1I0DVV5_9GAMM|nr:HAMP domain-containing sensor histidine kinase [Thorsellia anophelis]SET36645.1 two-component system, NtrC family, sensor histidine kinase GlrK [Thorsellia anophelis DSM 18579]